MVKKQDQDLVTQKHLQAVVLADSFAKNFRPISLESPKALLPLANVPMIRYTVEFLAANGVQEICVVCCSHAQDIAAYLNDCTAQNLFPGVTVRPIKPRAACFRRRLLVPIRRSSPPPLQRNEPLRSSTKSAR